MRTNHGMRLATGALALAALTGACGGEDARTASGDRSVAVASPVTAEPTRAIPVVDTQPVPEPSVPRNVTYADAETVYHARRYSDAAEMFGVYVESHPENGWGHYMLGLSAWKAGTPDRAIASFERVVELDSSNVKARTNLARVLLDENRGADALIHLEAARELAPESGDVRRVLGNALSELGRAEEALVAYRAALVLDPGDAWAMNNYALQLIRLGRFEEALPPLARAIELMPTVAVFQNNLGVALERSGDLAGASAAYAAAVAADSTHGRARASLERVSPLAGATDGGFSDLRALALGFMDEMKHWSTAELPEIGVR